LQLGPLQPLLYIFSLPHSLPLILIHALLVLLGREWGRGWGGGVRVGRGGAGRGGGLSSLVTCSDPEYLNFTDPAQPRRAKKYIY